MPRTRPDIRRRRDWAERLGPALQPAEKVWSVSDCATWSATACEAMTDVNPAAPYRGRYATEMEGIALLKAAGHRSFKAWVDSLFPRVEPARARRGDWAWVRQPDDTGRKRYALAVVDGAFLRTSTGVRLPRSEALTCWSVG